MKFKTLIVLLGLVVFATSSRAEMQTFGIDSESRAFSGECRTCFAWNQTFKSYYKMNPYKVAAGFFVNGEQYKSAQFLTGVPLLFSMIQAPQVRSAATLSEHMTRYGSLLMVPVPNGSWAVFPYQSPNGKRIPVPKAILDIFPNLDWNGTPEDLLKSLVHEVAEGRPVAHQALKRDFYWIPGNEFAQVYNKHSIFPTETFITFDLPSQPE